MTRHSDYFKLTFGSFFAVVFSLYFSHAAAIAEPTTHPKTNNTPVQEKIMTTTHALFAGGCFWCMEPEFDQTPGVIKTIVGYTGGAKAHPSYEEVSRGNSGHLEAIEVTYDPAIVTYEKLLDIYWSNIDPTDNGGQFADRGSHYRPVIFFSTPEEKTKAQASRDRLQASAKFPSAITVAIEPASPFFPAEEYHQDYYKKNPTHYNAYKEGSGRGSFIRKYSGK